MEALNYQQLVTAAIAVVAIVISWVSLVRSGKLQRQQMRLQTKQEELIDLQLQSLRNQAASVQVATQEKADVRVDLGQHGKDYKFVITNWGRVPARNVRFDLEPREGKTSPLVQGDCDVKIPIAELAPGGRCPLFAALTSVTGTAFEASWTWQNPDGSEETRSSLLAI
jgi:hypothetical protein